MLLHWLYSAGQDAADRSLAEERVAMRNVSAAREDHLCEKVEPEWKIEEYDTDSETCSIYSIPDTNAVFLVDKHAAMAAHSLKERRPSTASTASTTSTISITSSDCFSIQGTLISASEPPSLPALDDISGYKDSCVFNEDEIYGDNADTFVIPPGQYRLYLQQRNGTWSNELAAGIRTPFATLARAGRSGGRKMGRVPGALKRTFNETADVTATMISDNINSVTAKMDVPKIGDALIGEVFRAPQHWAALKDASRQALRKLDNGSTPEFLVFRKRRAGRGDDYEFMERMGDAARLFAQEMGARAREALVKEGICEDYRVVGFLDQMRSALARFYVEYKPYMGAKELMEADLRWAAGEDFFSLELEAIWPRGTDQQLNVFGWEATGFYLSDTGDFCKISAAAYLEREMLNGGQVNSCAAMSFDNDMASSTSACDGSTKHRDTKIEDEL